MPWWLQVKQPQGGGSLALPRWQLRLARQTGNPRLLVSSSVTTLNINIARKVAPTPQPDSDESYRLTVNGAGIQLDAETRFGARRSMETLLQLVHNRTLPLVTITDPRASHGAVF